MDLNSHFEGPPNKLKNLDDHFESLWTQIRILKKFIEPYSISLFYKFVTLLVLFCYINLSFTVSELAYGLPAL